MKRILLWMALSLGLLACGGGNAKTQESNDADNTKDRIEVLYFHGKKRCATCMAIEQRTRETLEEQFADELKNGSLVFRVIDISQPENEALADKYEVTWSSLFVCRRKGGRETPKNMTEFAFGSARKAPRHSRPVWRPGFANCKNRGSWSGCKRCWRAARRLR